jgi:hypothetical protein
MSNRRKPGWTYKIDAPSTKGPQSKCRGCKLGIRKNEERLQHIFFRNVLDKWPENHKYHCSLACLGVLGESERKEFAKKKWPQANVRALVSSLKSQPTQSSEEDNCSGE